MPSRFIGCSKSDHAYVTPTANCFVVVLPAVSVAVHETFVVPSPKFVPEAGEHWTGTTLSKSSVAAALFNKANGVAAEGAPTEGRPHKLSDVVPNARSVNQLSLTGMHQR